MNTPILTTKLFFPPLPPNIVRRPRLIEQLNEGIRSGCALTLISAPAGFGKTTLVREWMDSLTADPLNKEETAPRVGWLSLDEGDKDPGRFLAYVIAALRHANGIEATLGERALTMLRASRSQPPPIEAALASLINEIVALPQEVALVLDDYHVVDSPQVDDALAFLLEHLPPQLELVIVTRHDPHLPLARLRAQGQLTELRAVDLRFTFSEAAEFLNRVMGLDLSPRDIGVLETRTEGWIVGLQLAAISMQGRNDTTNLIRSFAGSHRYVLDYLIEEVLEHQPANIKAFLLQTAVLDRFNGSLCDALTGQGNGQATLELLDRANLFVIPLDEERSWYRYHHLFADLLRQQLPLRQPDLAPTLHRRASAWFDAHGFADQAIEHALRAEDFVQAAQLLEDHIDGLWGQGEHRTLQRWLDSLPEQVLFSKPSISIFQARYQCSSGQLDAAERTLRVVEESLEALAKRGHGVSEPDQFTSADADRMKQKGRIAATRALLCSFRGDVPGIIKHGSQALAWLPEDDLAWRSATALTLGSAHGFRGDMPAAYEILAEALKSCEAAGDIYPIMLANLQLAITLREQGHLQRTIEICRQQMELANEYGMAQTRLIGYLLAVWGEVLAEQNDLDGAVDRAQLGFELTGRSGHVTMIGWSFMCLMRTLMSRGDLAEAEATLAKMEAIGRDSRLPPWVMNQMRAWQTRLWLEQGKLEAAAQWLATRGLANGRDGRPLTGVGYFLLFEYLIAARILLAQGRIAAANQLLVQLITAAEAGDRTSSVIATLVLQASAHQAAGQLDRAVTVLVAALSLAEPKGFVRVFVDEGPPMARLLLETHDRGIMLTYVRRLLRAFPDGERVPTKIAAAGIEHAVSIESLSERENEVLQLIAEGLTNREIADRLFLSPNTVKVHARNIYGKLGAHHRAEAVARARALGVLPIV